MMSHIQTTLWPESTRVDITEGTGHWVFLTFDALDSRPRESVTLSFINKDGSDALVVAVARAAINNLVGKGRRATVDQLVHEAMAARFRRSS